jgi:hypothetical protein
MAVPVKKSRKPAPAVKYLLSGDRKLQRLSLKKISDSARAKSRTRGSRVKPPADVAAASAPLKPITGRLVVVGAVCLFAAAALLAARQPATQPDDASAAAAPVRSATAARAESPAVPPSIDKTPSASPLKKTPPAKTAPSTIVKPAAAAQTATAPPTNTARVTVEGCLDSDGPAFRLKNTTGLDTPKARTWRTGFLMKRSSSIGLVDTTGRLGLQDYIGKRVAATGSVVDREMRATTLREVAASCR